MERGNGIWQKIGYSGRTARFSYFWLMILGGYNLMDKNVVEFLIKAKKATYADLSEILNLQKLAYQNEAKLLNDYSIQPLTQTLNDLQNEFKKYKTGIILKLINEENNQIIGSVRAHERNNRIYIGKLIVHPDYQNKGFGTKLLNEIETYFENKTFEIFTSSKSEKNLNIYKKNGYKEFKKEKGGNNFEFIYLEK
jgi:RimJ/RimL family protein N-acetyltransferase